MKSAWIIAAVAAAPLALAAPSHAAPTHGKSFIEHAIKGNNSEIKLGKLAARKGATPGVRDFGKMLEHDHTRAREAAAAVAKQLGAGVPNSMTDEAKDAYQRFSKLSGIRFDRQFVAYMVTDHKKDIADFAAATHDSNKRIARLASQTLPTLHRHLEMAERLQVRTAPHAAQSKP